MTRSTKLMLPGLAFCVIALPAHGLALYVAGAIGVILTVVGGAFWISDRE